MLTTKDRDELRTGLEEPATFADRLVGAIELHRPRAVSIGELATVTSGVRVVVTDGQRDADALDELRRPEVLLGDGVVRDPRVDERHAAENGDRASQRSPRGSCPG